MKTTIQLAAKLCLLFASASLAFAQGSLTPPGAPAPTFKTLDQIEPRTPISSLPFNISTAGHYYLTKSATTTNTAITINADDVVLDLGGFTLTGDGDLGDKGVNVSAQARVTIRNGTLRNFENGVFLGASGAGTSEALVEDLVLVENNGAGLSAPVLGTNILVRSVIRRVRAIRNSGNGMTLFTVAGGAPPSQNIIEHCEAVNNTGNGIAVGSPGNLIVHCRASGNGGTGNYNIGTSNRFGLVMLPTASSVNGSSGGAGTGTTDPFANLSF